MTIYFSCKVKRVSMFTKSFSWKLCDLSCNPSSCLWLNKLSSCEPALQVSHRSGSGIGGDESLLTIFQELPYWNYT